MEKICYYIGNRVNRWCNVAVLTTLLALSPSAANAQLVCQRQDSLTVCGLLQQAPADAGTLWFARQFLGRPYVAHTLEVGDGEPLVVNTRALDCTTLVETVVALTLCRQQQRTSWHDYLALLESLRYRQGKRNGYASRLHYFSDWIDDKEHMSIVKEIQGPNPPFAAIQRVVACYMSQHPQHYKALREHPDLLPAIRRQEEAITGMERRYVPKAAIGNTTLLRQTVHDGDIIAIVCNKPGLEIAHLGFAVWHKDGLHLLNASQLHKRVVDEPMTLRRYLKKHPSHLGIRVIRLNGRK